MTDTATLIERLRAMAERAEGAGHPVTTILREAADALASADSERDALSRQMRLVARMAEHGVAADTTPEQCLATIAHFAEAALVAVEPPDE